MAISIDDAKVQLSKFLSNHPNCSVTENDDDNGTPSLAVHLPWDDKSLILRLREEIDGLFDALNSVLLPAQFSAIWHQDACDMEIIWTALPLQGGQKEIENRTFLFKFDGEEYKCEFAPASTRLLKIAESAEFVDLSDTHWRNLWTFKEYKDNEDDDRSSRIPLSFWIRKIEWNDECIIELASHLNFYLSYFDSKSPTIIIHPPKVHLANFNGADRYKFSTFPTIISGKKIDSNLLHYWNAAQSGDPARRYLYYFRIIEYSSSIYIDATNRAALRRVLSSPNALEKIENVAEDVMLLMSKYKMDENARMDAMLKETVNPALLWSAINHNIDCFSQIVKFDGGFEISPITAVGGRQEDYCNGSFSNFGRQIRDIRNALSHGKDQKTQTVIVPTRHNLERLQPWVQLTCVAAGEVMLYRS